jgi:hypothetical protein
MQTKTLSNLVLEFPVLEKTTSKALKGGSYGPWAEIARMRGDYSWNSFTLWGSEFWDNNGNYMGRDITVHGQYNAWHNDPYDVRNGAAPSGNGTGTSGGGGDYGGGDNGMGGMV